MKSFAILAALAISPNIYADSYFENVSGIEFSAKTPEECFNFDNLRTYNWAVAGAECNTVIELKPEHHAALPWHFA